MVYLNTCGDVPSSAFIVWVGNTMTPVMTSHDDFQNYFREGQNLCFNLWLFTARIAWGHLQWNAAPRPIPLLLAVDLSFQNECRRKPLILVFWCHPIMNCDVYLYLFAVNSSEQWATATQTVQHQGINHARQCGLALMVWHVRGFAWPILSKHEETDPPMIQHSNRKWTILKYFLFYLLGAHLIC